MVIISVSAAVVTRSFAVLYCGCVSHIAGCVQTISVVGPVFGYLLGSLCAKIYVDIGFVNMGEIKHNPLGCIHKCET